jgi:uncharacterized membrane protein YhaH (DUF805 family)
MNWYLEVLKKYAVFTGRARRTEYWMFVLVSVIISVVLTVVEMVVRLPGVLSGLYALATLLPSIGVGVRRLHDTNRSGWWLLISLVPVIGVIVLIVFLATDSQPGSNQYGPNPKGAGA